MFSHFNRETANSLANWATYIVIGAGAAGSIVAARLAENPRNNVLLIELGPNNLGNRWIETPADSSYLWDHPDGPRPSPSNLAFETNVQLERKYHYPRGNGLGGSTNHNAMVDGRGSAQIYNKISELVGDERWSYHNVLPYFKKMESYNVPSADTNFHGSNGWLQIKRHIPKSPFHMDFIHAATEITQAPFQNDMSGNPNNADGVGFIELQITPEGKRSSAFDNLLIPQLYKNNNNLVVLLNTLVTRILIELTDRGLVAVGVEGIHKSNAYLSDKSAKDIETEQEALMVKFFASNEVILCGGAINTPQLLLLSGIGPRKHLTDIGIPVILDRPGVGSELMDHHEVAVVYEIDPNKTVWPSQAASIIDNIDSQIKQSCDNTELDELKSYLNKFADRTEQRETSGGVVIDWFSGLDTDIGHDLHISCEEGFLFDFDLSSNEPLPDGKLRTDYLRSQYNLRHPNFLRVFHHCLIEVLKLGRADGTIRLASPDPTVPPIIDLGLYKDEEAVERMARGIQMIRRLVQHPRIKEYYKVGVDGNPLEIFPSSQVQTIDELKQYLKRWSAFGHHISGTAKMGRLNNPNAVVDTHLRVYGIPNLRVVDTSIYSFPYLHGYNTARGAYLIGEIGADLIKETQNSMY
jgi:choline dehydrogenase-like flavoprotein